MKLKSSVKVFLFIIILGIAGYFLYPVIFKSNNASEKSNINSESKIVELLKANNIYEEKYKDEYSKITFSEKDNLKDVISTFLPLGYTGEEINYIMNLSELNIKKLKEKEHTDIKNYYNIKNFDVDKIDRYNAYYEKNNYSYEQVVTYVNIKLDLPVYTETVQVKDGDSLLVLVNKYNHLPDNYKPSDLEYMDGAYKNKVPMRKVAYDALEKLQKAAKEEININLLPTTAFRDQSFQATLYNNYVKSDGVAKADTYSARPSYSEHQTGLAIDLKNTALGSNIRLTDDNYKWLEENAHKYGFIIRFPKEKEFVTGYQFENWHIRYVGEDVAKIIYENKLALEEYIDLYETEY